MREEERVEISARQLLERYLPVKPDITCVLEWDRDKDFSTKEANKILMSEYREDMKGGIQEALYDYTIDPDKMGGEEFLVEVLSKLVDLL